MCIGDHWVSHLCWGMQKKFIICATQHACAWTLHMEYHSVQDVASTLTDKKILMSLATISPEINSEGYWSTSSRPRMTRYFPTLCPSCILITSPPHLLLTWHLKELYYEFRDVFSCRMWMNNSDLTFYTNWIHWNLLLLGSRSPPNYERVRVGWWWHNHPRVIITLLSHI